MDYYESLTRKEQEKQAKPKPARGYFISDLTIEGLQHDLAGSPHGGVLVIQDEISAFINAQNQYRNGRGTDREAWINLWDGHAARVKRASKTLFINGARVSIFGGIQPKVFATFFADDDGLYLKTEHCTGFWLPMNLLPFLS
jgi:Protein of unknown function (DUF3987)